MSYPLGLNVQTDIAFYPCLCRRYCANCQQPYICKTGSGSTISPVNFLSWDQSRADCRVTYHEHYIPQRANMHYEQACATPSQPSALSTFRLSSRRSIVGFHMPSLPDPKSPFQSAFKVYALALITAVKRIRRSSPWFYPAPRILCLTCMLFLMPIRPAHPMIDALPLAIAFCLVPICLVLPIRKSLPWLGQVLRQNSLAMAASEVTWLKALLAEIGFPSFGVVISNGLNKYQLGGQHWTCMH